MRRMTAHFAFLSFLLPLQAHAHDLGPPHLHACWSTIFSSPIACLPFLAVLQNAVNALFFASPLVMLAIFVAGATSVTLSAGRDTPLQRGKQMMIASLIGLAFVVGSYAIYRTVVFILYAGP
jgi:hypothetical protein